MRRAWIGLVAGVAMVLATSGSEVAHAERNAPFWARLQEPKPWEALRFEGLGHMARARQLATELSGYAPGQGLNPKDERLTELGERREKALKAFEEALVLLPDDPDLHYAAYLAARDLGKKGHASVVFHVEALMRIAPMHSQAYPLGESYVHALPKLASLQHGKAAHALYAKAAQAYEVHLARQGDAALYGARQDSPYSNAGEIYMAAGRLDEAVKLYRRSVELGPNQCLNRYGLALALDRAGEAESALKEMREAIRLDTTHELDGADVGEESPVYFVPSGDKLAYQALALEAGGRGSEAATMWTRFLKEAGDAQPAYRARAVQHLTRLGRRVPAHLRDAEAPASPEPTTPRAPSRDRRQ